MPVKQLSDLQVSRLLEPLQGDSPTGIPLETNSFNSPLNAVKEARDEAERCEIEHGKWQIETRDDEPKEKADWPQVIELASELLANTSKDLRAAAWLSEGLIRVYGVAGLKEALAFCVELSASFWGSLHPYPDAEEGHAAAVSGLRKLFGDLNRRALDDLCFVEAASAVPAGTPQRITFQQYRNISEYDRISEPAKKSRRRERFGWVTTEEYRQVAELTPTPHLQTLHADLVESIELVYRFGAFLRENCRPDRYGETTSPDNEIRQFREQIERMGETVSKLLEERGPIESDEHTDPGSLAGGVIPSEPIAGVPAIAKRPETLATREDAFRAIENIATFFEKQEPHSPVHFGLRQIVRWGRMSFPELLKELLEDDQTLNSLRKRVGLPPDK
jgi:type VI secretion system protein ImpA